MFSAPLKLNLKKVSCYLTVGAQSDGFGLILIHLQGSGRQKSTPKYVYM